MERLEKTYPVARQELMKIGISVRINEKGIGQAVDLAGEKSWVLCRRYQAKFTEALKTMANTDKTSDNVRKCLRPSEILKSNKIILSMISCIKTQFTDPFCEEFDQQKFYNLVSGQPVGDTIADSLLKIDEVGQKCLEKFKTKMVSDKAKGFFNPIAKKTKDQRLQLLKRKQN